MADSLIALISDLGKIPAVVYPATREVMERGAMDLKDQLNQNLKDSKHFKAAAGSVTYDGLISLGSIGFEVGPDKGRRAGAIANIAFFGGSNGGGATVDLDGAVTAAGDRTERFLGLAVEGLL